MRDIRVLMVGNDLSVKGGITSVISQILKHNWKIENIDMHFIPTYIDGSAAHKVTFFAKALRKIRRYIVKNTPDVVHIHMSYKGSFVRKYLIHSLCIRRGIPDVLHLHGSEFKKWYDESSNTGKNKIRKMLRESARVIVLGEKWNAVIKEIEPQAKTVIVGNTVHIPAETCGWNAERFQILFLGVLIKRKGVSELLQAIKVLKDAERIGNIRVVIAGSGEEESHLKNEAVEFGIVEHIEFIGWMEGEKKFSLLRDSQALVLPSHDEGLPVSILEAMSYGLPVIATDVGDVSTAVIDGQNGYLIKVGDVGSLADCIWSLASNKDMFQKMGCSSRHMAEDKFSDGVYFDKIKQCYLIVGSTN